jgi:hypothetical protein
MGSVRLHRTHAGSGAVCALLLAVALCGACGGGGADKPARSAADEDEPSGAVESAGAQTEEEDEEEAAPRKAACDDGTCTTCGSSMCPAGWYCDETAKGGPACGWLPECVNKLSCSCLNKTFSGCSCEEKDGGVHLSCG